MLDIGTGCPAGASVPAIVIEAFCVASLSNTDTAAPQYVHAACCAMSMGPLQLVHLICFAMGAASFIRSDAVRSLANCFSRKKCRNG